MDFVRVLAAILIVIFHYNVVSSDYPDIVKPNLLFVGYANGTMGHIGVSLFFILAGASLMYVYSEQLELKEYFKKRFFAIFPLYWTIYGAFFCYFYLLTGKLGFDRPLWRMILTVVGMDGYLDYMLPNYYLLGEWFVGCILLIYLCFPLLRNAMLRRPAVTAGAAVIGYIALTALYPFQMEIQYCFLIRIPEVLFGMYFMKYFYEKRENRERFGWKWAAPSGVCLLLALTVPLPGFFSQPYRILWTGIPCFLFLLWMGGKIRGKRIRAVITYCSRYTFSLYLVHHILVGKFLFPFSGKVLGTGQNLLLFSAYFLFCCAAAWIFYQIGGITARVIKAVWGMRAERIATSTPGYPATKSVKTEDEA